MAAATLVMFLAFLTSRFLDLGQDSSIAIATIRTIVQLTALGYILLPIFQNNKPIVVLPWLLVMTLLAAREAWAKPKSAYPGMFVHIWIALLIALSATMTFASWLVFQQTPWWDAKIVIPISGMLLGNAMTTVTLAMERMLTECTEGRERVELLLTRGATQFEALLPVIRSAINVGITPTLNTMNVIGLVSLPGMMTGQILGGGLPVVAAKYQMLIMFLIAGNAIGTMLAAVTLTGRALFDPRARLRLNFLVKRAKKQQDLVMSLGTAVADAARGTWRVLCNRPAQTPDAKNPRSASPIPAPLSPEEIIPLLSSSNPPRATWKVDTPPGPQFFMAEGLSQGFKGQLLWQGLTFGLPKGSLLIINGPNGCGKSTLLRALCDIQSSGVGTASLQGAKASTMAPWDWRSRVLYLQQGHHLSLPGTPQSFLEKLLSLRINKTRPAVKVNDAVGLASSWGMTADLWSQEWATLSGGQVQHLHLAIALSSSAEVLLLDEPLSACDPAAVLELEAAIVAHPAAKVIITHDEEQTHRLTARGAHRLVFEVPHAAAVP